MRLKSVGIEGFRGFVDRADVDLDADVIILHGPNGVGKTSLLDAILWALTGSIERFGNRGSPVSLYSREGFARVELVLRAQSGDLTIVRTSDGQRENLRLRTSDTEIEGVAANEHLAGLLLANGLDQRETLSSISDVLTRSIYLQQDLVREFIETDTSSDRFSLVSKVIGAGVILDLQSTLEQSRAQWSRSMTSARKDDLNPLLARLQSLIDQTSQIDESSNPGDLNLREEATRIYSEATKILGQYQISLPEPPTTSTMLDRLLKQLAAERNRTERALGTATELLNELAILGSQSSQEGSAAIDRATLQFRTVSDELSTIDAAVEAAVAERSSQLDREVAAVDKANRLATMAKLALDELGGTCPVCQQVHDQERTVRHLQELIAMAEMPLPSEPVSTDLDRLSAQRTNIRRQLEEVRSQRDNLIREVSALANRRENLNSRIRDFGVDEGSELGAGLSARRAQIEDRLARITALLREGEQLALNVVRLGEQRRSEELSTEIENLRIQTSELKQEIESRERTHALAGRIIDELRNASLAVTNNQIESVAPLFQRIYSRIDPHPTFRVTQILASMEKGRGRLNVGIYDPDQGDKSHDAGPILSSSQLNSFAVSLFLSLNVALPSLQLKVTMLDDPLQSLDAINLLGLVDVLRRFRTHRQIIVSTHEPRLLGLLQRKLRPVRESERMLTVLFESWSRSGPVVRVMPMLADQDANVLAA